MAEPSIITTDELRHRLGVDEHGKPRVSRSALYTWLMQDPKWRGCIVHSSRRKMWLSVQRLIDHGILPRPDAPRVTTMPAAAFAYRVDGVA